MNVLLTGGTGFLGSRLAERFMGLGLKCANLARAHSNSTKRTRSVTGLIDYVYSNDGDLRDIVTEYKPELILHTACNYGRRGESIYSIVEDNISFGVRLLEACINQSERDVVFFNTGSSLESSVSYYAAAKKAFSELLHLTGKVHSNLRVCNFVLEHLYGPGDSNEKFPTFVVSELSKNSPELKLTSGRQRRDFVYINDVVDAYEIVFHHRKKLGAFEDIPLGSGQSVEIREFVELAAEITGSNSELKFGSLPDREDGDVVYCADISKLESLGFKPKYDLRKGLVEIVEDMQSRG